MRRERHGVAKARQIDHEYGTLKCDISCMGESSRLVVMVQEDSYATGCAEIVHMRAARANSITTSIPSLLQGKWLRKA